MKIKNRSVTTGFIAALAIFSSTVSYAGQTCQEMPGELHIISVTGSSFDEPGDDLEQDNRIKLSEQAKVTCSGGEFCVEDASIKTKFFFHTWRRILHATTTAVVNCLK